MVLVKLSRSFPQEVMDWKKLVRICKDCFDEQYNIFFEDRDNTGVTARSIWHDWGKIPITGIIIPIRNSSRQIVEEFLKNALELRAVIEKITEMSVRMKDEINLLPMAEDRPPSVSMISITFSPWRSY